MAMTKVQEAEAKAAAVAREAEERLNQPMLIGGVELRRGLGAIISKQFKVTGTLEGSARTLTLDLLTLILTLILTRTRT